LRKGDNQAREQTERSQEAVVHALMLFTLNLEARFFPIAEKNQRVEVREGNGSIPRP
jgi:hypothetical protein